MILSSRHLKLHTYVQHVCRPPLKPQMGICFGLRSSDDVQLPCEAEHATVLLVRRDESCKLQVDGDTEFLTDTHR